ncbi:MAG: CRTAC1 family protein [Planctomycetota bacterium]
MGRVLAAAAAAFVAVTLVVFVGLGGRSGGEPSPPTAPAAGPGPPPPAEEWFRDVAAERGITQLNQTGVPGRKELIMGAVGPGAAWFDANGDGLLDLYVPNGSWLVGPKRDRFYDGPDRPRNSLYIQTPDHRFVEEARRRGVDDDAWSFGACAADLDNDGDQDLVVTNFGANRLYRNDGRGFFVDVAVAAGVAGADDEWSTGIAVGDYDRDGLPDLYIANYADMFEWLQKCPDVKRDPATGEILEARVCKWQGLDVYCGPKGLPGQQDHLYRSLGGLRFQDVTARAGLRLEEPLYGFQVLFTDLNHDGWPDIYVANDSVPSTYFESGGDGTFRERAGERGVRLGRTGEEPAGRGADSADLNGDGYLDLNKTNFAADTYNVYVAERMPDGTPMFKDYSTRTGIEAAVYNSLGWGVAIFDYDHDGDPDVFYANGHVYPEVDAVPALKMSFKQRNQLFRNDRAPGAGAGDSLRFTQVTDFVGSGLRLLHSSRGAALADFDEDGDLDILVVNLNDRPNLLLNELGSRRGHWLKIRLVGNPALRVNLDAIGCTVTVRAGDRVQFLESKRGQSWLGCHDPRLHVGLGDHTGPVTVEVVWPNGRQTRHDLPGVDRVVTLTLGRE